MDGDRVKMNNVCEIENCNKPKKIARRHRFGVKYFAFCEEHYREWKEGMWINKNGRWVKSNLPAKVIEE